MPNLGLCKTVIFVFLCQPSSIFEARLISGQFIKVYANKRERRKKT